MPLSLYRSLPCRGTRSCRAAGVVLNSDNGDSRAAISSRSIKALRLALRLALYCTIGSISVRSIEALSAVLIVQRIIEFQGRCRVLLALLLNGPIRIFHAGHGKSLLAR